MATPKRRYAFQRDLPHLQCLGRPLAVTLATHQRWELPPEARDIVFDSCLREHLEKRALMHILVVMPNHVHLLFTPLWDSAYRPYSIAQLMAGIKGATAHRINALLDRKGHVWQTEYFDHVVRKGNFQAKFDYIFQNPVAARLVEDPRDYPWLWINPDEQ